MTLKAPLEDGNPELGDTDVPLLPLPAELTADWIIVKLMAIASADMSTLIALDAYGFPSLDVSVLTPAQKLAIQDITASTSKTGKRITIKPADKLKALDMLAKYLDLFKDSLTVDVEVSLVEKLQAGRGRMNKDVKDALAVTKGHIRLKDEKQP